MAYDYTQQDQKILAKAGRQKIEFYSEYLAKAQKAGYDSLFEYVKALYKQHYSTKKVGSIVGVVKSTINTWLKLAGCELRSKGGRYRVHNCECAKGDEKLYENIIFYPEYLAKAKELGHDSLASCIQSLYCDRLFPAVKVGKILGSSETIIYKSLKLIGCKTRPKGFRNKFRERR